MSSLIRESDPCVQVKTSAEPVPRMREGTGRCVDVARNERRESGKRAVKAFPQPVRSFCREHASLRGRTMARDGATGGAEDGSPVAQEVEGIS